MQLVRTILVFSFVQFSMTGLAQYANLDSMRIMAELGKANIPQVDLLVSISDSLFRSNPQKAIEYATRGSELATRVNYPMGKGNALKSIGMGYFAQGDYPNAVNYFQQALETFEFIGYKKGIANMLNNQGVIYNNQGNDARALELYLKSLKISEEINDSVRIVTALINIGLIYSKKENTLDQAESYYLRALPISEELEYFDAIGTVSVNLGELLYAKKDLQGALGYFEKSREAFQKTNSISLPVTFISIGKIYADLKDFENAIKYQEQALQFATERSAKYEMTLALLGLANTFQQKGDIRKALYYYKQSERIANEIGAKYILQSNYEGLSSAYSRLSDYKNAYLYQAKLSALKDTIFSETSQLQISQLQVQSQIEAMLSENEILKRDVKLREAKNQQQTIVIFFLLLGVVSISIFMAVLIRTIKLKKKANAELADKNTLITLQKKEITDSIQYASRIQAAMLTPESQIAKYLPENFILFRPRDIVSGDFYWFAENEGRIICIAADCTGHGVPGAFMSMLGIAFLNEIISKNPEITANEILNEMRKQVVSSLRQGGQTGETTDGMDVSLIILDKNKKRIEYAGANNPLILIRNNELMEYKPDKMPIGFHYADELPFTVNYIEIEKGDMIYLFSDGFSDQFGGPDGKRLMIRRFRNFLMEVYQKDLSLQKQILEQRLEEWKGETDQIDDILLVGIRI
jgi:serine phosphatase RsbU (regulator of sigma subunit)